MNMLQLSADGLARRDMPGSVIRATDNSKRQITGIGVPYGQEIELAPGLFERFAPGAAADDEAALAVYRHRELIGRRIAGEDTAIGRKVTLQLSETAQGIDAYKLAADGVIRSLSIGFVPIEYKEHKEKDRTVIEHIKVEVREYSLVPWPAYSAARIVDVREAQESSRKETSVTVESSLISVSRTELDAVADAAAQQITELRAEMAALSAATGTSADPLAAAERFSSIGAYIRAAADDSDPLHATALELHRAITTADLPARPGEQPGFIGDLTKTVAVRRPWLNRFGKQTLPAKGMTVEYYKTSTTVEVAEQSAELAALPTSDAPWKLEESSARIRTFGGGAKVSRQVIERTDAAALTSLWTAFAMQYARETEKATKQYIESELDKIVQAAKPGSVLTMKASWSALDWLAVIVDAVETLSDKGFPLTTLAVSKDIYLKLLSATDSTGAPLMLLQGDGTNRIGGVNLPAGTGSLARVEVALLSGAKPNTAGFFDPSAIVTYESPNAPAWIQADAVLSLSRDYACYGYLAHSLQFPEALLPVKFAG